MSFREMQLEKALAQPGCAVFYFYSTQEFLVRDAAQKTVRRLMQDIGFRMERLPGPPGGKREILRATKPNDVPENMPELYR